MSTAISVCHRSLSSTRVWICCCKRSEAIVIRFPDLIFPVASSKKKDGGKCCDPGPGLQCKHAQRLCRIPWHPPDREERDHWYLRGHEQLKDMSRSSLIGLMDNAV